ncbi:MAG: hypothetical protein GYA55_12660 [SAR324 cluster bacterium]|uniref:Inositol monophosphatase n=1 Tax=SAR324 cluster bacterium TaxID=2024889 RepID=A0A7X9FTF3_9DELT|nr:hypothetical protein [SAR324 cluster bacterium]
MSLVDKNKEAKLEELLRRAGDILLDYWPGGSGALKSRLESFQKSDASIVTTADLEVNALLSKGLSELFPGLEIMSEEMPETHELRNRSSFCILDPLDGTKHFAAGASNFSILLAFVEDGNLNYGAMYMPAQGDYLCAAKGRGCLFNGHNMRVSEAETPRPSSIFIEHFDAAPSLFLTQEKLDSSEAIKKICSAELDGVVIRLRKHKTWDIAALIPLVEESGGRISDEHGAMPYFESSEPGFAYLLVSNGQIHDFLLERIVQKKNGEAPK